ncbi:MAG TPA: HypC/HybG/HupF family hydrogenase formation chaperone [Rugosimonospora sp.]|nr:HypC/HybG/HupF family hydrogenase formation chaperone [Rugosimonospora sp.]
MCLGIPAQVTALDAGHPDLVQVDMAGVPRMVNIGVLDEPRPPEVGDWLLVHMGFALSIITEQEARDALGAYQDERRALEALLATEETP